MRIRAMLRDNLIMLRHFRGFSQSEIAERIGISRQAYAKWESGLTTPDIIKCAALANIYDVSIDSLIQEKHIAEIDNIPPAPKGRHIWGTVTIGDRGQIVIPKSTRESMNLNGGDRLVVLSDDSEGIALVPVTWFENRLQQLQALASIDHHSNES